VQLAIIEKIENLIYLILIFIFIFLKLNLNLLFTNQHYQPTVMPRWMSRCRQITEVKQRWAWIVLGWETDQQDASGQGAYLVEQLRVFTFKVLFQTFFQGSDNSLLLHRDTLVWMTLGANFKKILAVPWMSGEGYAPSDVWFNYASYCLFTDDLTATYVVGIFYPHLTINTNFKLFLSRMSRFDYQIHFLSWFSYYTVPEKSHSSKTMRIAEFLLYFWQITA
jgi:hypothetical protein